MRIALGRRGDYSVRAMLDLSRHHGQGRRKSREIAASMELPRKYLSQILGTLIRQGLVVSAAGPDGGYSLARSPSEISLLEVIEVAEGPLQAVECALNGGPCDWGQVCPLHETWAQGQEALIKEFAGTSFADLAAIDARIEAGTYGHTTEIQHRRPRKGQRTPPPPPT